jgi:lysozyme
MNDQLTYSGNGMALTESFESLELEAYKDVRGVWTIGWGHTGKLVHAGLQISEDQAKSFLATDVMGAELAVRSYIRAVLTQNQFDALVDFTFNEGAQHLKESTLLLRLNAGDNAAAATEFMRWVYAAGEVEPGLQRRRTAEQKLFLTA